MIVAMVMIMYTCVAVKNENDGTLSHRIWGEPEQPTFHQSLNFSDFEAQYFWQWTSFPDYIIFLSLFSLTCVGLTVAMLEVKPVIQLLGFVSLLTEASLGAPQLWRNFRKHSTQGMRYESRDILTLSSVYSLSLSLSQCSNGGLVASWRCVQDRLLCSEGLSSAVRSMWQHTSTH